MFFKLFCRAPRMRITGLVVMLVIVFVGVTVAVIVVVRMAIAMVVTMRMPIAMIVTVRMIVVMSAACCSPRLSLLGKQLLHTLFEVGVRLRHEVINYGYWLETYRFQRTQQCIGRLLTPRKLNEGSAGLKAYAVGI